MSQPYEALVILKALGTESDLAQAVSQMEEPIKGFGGRIDQSANWGRRRLTYRIARQQEGYYHLVTFQMEPNRLTELKRAFQLNETIVRYIILNRADQPVSKPANGDGQAPSAAGRPTPVRAGDRER